MKTSSLLFTLVALACTPVETQTVVAAQTHKVRLADTTASPSPKARLDAQRADELARLATKSQLMDKSLRRLAAKETPVTVSATPVQPEPAQIVNPAVPTLKNYLDEGSVEASTSGVGRCGTEVNGTVGRACAPRL